MNFAEFLRRSSVTEQQGRLLSRFLYFQSYTSPTFVIPDNPAVLYKVSQENPISHSVNTKNISQLSIFIYFSIEKRMSTNLNIHVL